MRNITDPEQVPDWVGKKLWCKSCKTLWQLESNDAPKIREPLADDGPCLGSYPVIACEKCNADIKII